MAPSKVSRERFETAVTCMHAIGIQSEIVTPVLENLLQLYDYNWEHIEADNFRVLTDAIFDDPEPKGGHKRQANERINLDSDHYNKKPRIKPTSKMNVHDRRELAEAPLQQEVGKLCHQIVCQGKGTGSKSRLPIKERNMEIEVPEDTPTDEDRYNDALRNSGLPHADKDASGSLERNLSDACSSQAITSNNGFSTNFDVASSSSGAGKLSFTYISSLAHHSDFRVPDMELICKEMEARCLRKFKIVEPNFSFMKLLEDTCQCILDLGCESSGPRERGIVQIAPAMDYLSKPSVPRDLQSNQADSSCMPANNRMMLGGICSSSAVAGEQNISSNMQVIQHQLTIVAKGPPHDVNDITKGEECLSIPIINESGNGILPPPFHYIPCNIVFQNAYINLSRARIGDESCCSDCYGDCLAQPLPCACARETGGEFAYTGDGLLKERFLDCYVSMLKEPDKHHQFRCKDCPNERVKLQANSDSPNTKVNPAPCKGHLTRKFIKECWSKCGCTRNRVVQRGITRHLQVFLTPGKKGWGLRAAEELPRGAFICEYVGEILTNTELYERTIQKTAKSRHTYPVLLDADWVTEGVLEDDHALCLDATFYGNVARFINHRCFDANIIGIPVEIETPDHHYYHDYGIDFYDVNHTIKAFKCRCGSEHCRDKRSISSRRHKTTWRP
ncbi:hypothetical protein BRADI_3g48980v3 [Brachypodium distachyon]|uniref:SET domain-containing protein n=1 Tax=Brachypodium distachyon TaxID=15368 RepID=A0A0Q3QEZ3_BRADI|nr:hypothetical protein BRADI_3g48980v3 [Brachypodium distachyon]